MNSNPETEPLIDYKDKEFQNEKEIESLINDQIRKGFIVKVYSILLIQLLITTLFVILALYFPSLKSFLNNSTLFYILALILIFSVLPVLICYPHLLKAVPYNYIFLFVFTLGESYLVAMFTCNYTPKSVIVALILTLSTVLSLTYYAWTCKSDFTIYGGVLSSLLCLLIVGSFILIFVRIPFLYLVTDIFSLMLFSAYLIYDTQIIVRNDTKYHITSEDYILAALNLYLDIINIFIEFLSLFGSRN